jgi:hypothetical protein
MLVPREPQLLGGARSPSRLHFYKTGQLNGLAQARKATLPERFVQHKRNTV